jgi:hypothetical protein
MVGRGETPIEADTRPYNILGARKFHENPEFVPELTS